MEKRERSRSVAFLCLSVQVGEFGKDEVEV